MEQVWFRFCRSQSEVPASEFPSGSHVMLMLLDIRIFGQWRTCLTVYTLISELRVYEMWDPFFPLIPLFNN